MSAHWSRPGVLLAAGLAVGSASLPAAAADCRNPQTQADMNECAFQAWQDADQALNAIWGPVKLTAQALDAELPPALRGIWQSMLDGQRAWLTYRDKSCEAEAGIARGGTAESMLYSGCRERVTWERVSALRGFVDAVH